MAVAASMLPFALNGCYTKMAAVGDDENSDTYGQYSDYDTTGGQVTVNNYFGSDSYRDWRYRSSFRYYPHQPYWLWSTGWNDPYWCDDYDPWCNTGWDAWGGWGYSPYWQHPWSRHPGWPPYTYYSEYGYGNPNYYGSSIHGIPIYSYGGASVSPRRRDAGPTRGGDVTVRPVGALGGAPLASPVPSTGAAIARPSLAGDKSNEVRTEARPKTRPSQETPWWLRTVTPRSKNTGSTDAQAMPEARRRPTGGSASTQPQVKRDRPRPTGNRSVPTDATSQRRPRNGSTSQQPPPSRPQSRESVNAPSRQAPRSAPASSTPPHGSTARSRKAE